MRFALYRGRKSRRLWRQTRRRGMKRFVLKWGSIAVLAGWILYRDTSVWFIQPFGALSGYLWASGVYILMEWRYRVEVLPSDASEVV